VPAETKPDQAKNAQQEIATFEGPLDLASCREPYRDGRPRITIRIGVAIRYSGFPGGFWTNSSGLIAMTSRSVATGFAVGCRSTRIPESMT
jgi:hypothetical protein